MTIDHAVSRYAQDAPVVSLDDGKDLAGVLSRISPSPHVSPTTVSPRPNPRRPNPRRLEAKDIDWRTVVSLRRKASERISSERASHRERTGVDLSGDDVRMLGRSIVRQAVESHAENIEINGCDRVFVQYGDGRREPGPVVADDDAELVEAIRFLGESANPPRPFDDAHPTMTVALGSQYRLHAIGFGLSYRPSVVIRHHTLTRVTIDDLVNTAMMPHHVGVLLRAAVLARRSIVIAGDQGAGKTTLLRALVDAIPPTERFGTLETDYELLTHLNPDRDNMVAFQATVGLGEKVDGHCLGEFTVADLIPEALRQNLSRLVVGEVRGVEAAAMFEAMQAGAGTMSTTHSHSATSTMDRLAGRVAMGGVMTIEEAYRQIAHNITFLVHVTLVDDTWRGGTRTRHITEIRQLTGALENGRPVTHLTYAAPTPTSPGMFHPDPALVAELSHYEPEVTRWI